MPPRATIFLHCGLHKTATTAIQAFCADHRAQLASLGYLYPETGDTQNAHHNLAWQITGDRRFDAAAITVEKVEAEIAAFPGHVILSSEDFEGILHRIGQLKSFVERLAGTGKKIRLVIYVRDRREYTESLYLELLKHGYAGSFRAFCASCRNGRLAYRQWTFHLDPERVLTGLHAAGFDVIRRRYAGQAAASRAVADFLSAVGVQPELIGPIPDSIYNKRKPAAENLADFLEARLGRLLVSAERAVVNQLAQDVVLVCAGRQAAAGNGLPARLNRFFSVRTFEAVTGMFGHDPAQIACSTQAGALRAWWGKSLLAFWR